MRIAIIVVFMIVSFPVLAQYKVFGIIQNNSGTPLYGSTIVVSNQVLVSNEKGAF